jgi:hypothetical protein
MIRGRNQSCWIMNKRTRKSRGRNGQQQIDAIPDAKCPYQQPKQNEGHHGNQNLDDAASVIRFTVPARTCVKARKSATAPADFGLSFKILSLADADATASVIAFLDR